VSVQAAEAAHEETLEAMESFLNLGADEVDIRTIRRNFTLVAEFKVRFFSGCLERKPRSTSPAVEQRLKAAYIPSEHSCRRPGNESGGAE
jgi:hypothetical protein